ncbi:unnamed protein product [Diamesa serratosioi]
MSEDHQDENQIYQQKETKIIYHIDDESTPYLVKICLPPPLVKLRDFKIILSKQQTCSYKFFFKSIDADFGVVKEEVIDDDTILPTFNGKVVAWLVTSNDASSENPDKPDGQIKIHPKGFISAMIDKQLTQSGDGPQRLGEGGQKLTYQTVTNFLSSSSDLASSTSFFDDEETENDLERKNDTYYDYDENLTEYSSILSSQQNSRLKIRKKPQRRKKRPPQQMSRTSSYSSITDSTMSLNIITVQINMDTVNFLGISIVGQSNRGGDGGIYVGSIMKGGAVALDGRIEPGDMILQVNDINFENMTNDEAVKVLREVVQKPGPVKLVVAKCWDPNPKGKLNGKTILNQSIRLQLVFVVFFLGYFTIPRTEPVRPIDPGAWVAHTQALRSCESLETDSDATTIKQSRLNINMPYKLIVQAMRKPDSGLEIRDRLWLKITIPNAFIGSDLVNWIIENVDGVNDRREARKYIANMLRKCYIKHTVNKLTFSEQCYYVVGEGDVGHNAYMLDDSESIISDHQQLPKPPMSMSSGAGGTLPHLQQMQKASSKSSTTSKSCSSTESQKIMIKNLIQQTNHMTLKNGDGKNSKSSSNSSSKGAVLERGMSNELTDFYR